MATANTQEVSTRVRYNVETLANLKSFDDVLALFKDSGTIVQPIADFGDGFKRLEAKDKDVLVKVPFAIIEFSILPGDYADEHGNRGSYALVHVMTKHGEKFAFTDGSATGIGGQLVRAAGIRIRNGADPTNAYRGIMVPGGLRRSDFEYADANGVMQPGTAYYLSE